MPDLKNPNAKDWAAVAAKPSENTSQTAQDESEPKNEKNVLPEEVPELTQLSASECEAKLSAAEKKAEECMSKYLQVLAEMENVRRRAEKDIANAHKFAIEKFAFEVLIVADNLERTLEVRINGNELVKNIHAGVELTLKSLMEILQKFGVVQINPVGEIFNPDKHSAVSVREDPTVKSNTVIQVLQKGYLLKERLLRPAMVVVAK